MSYNGIFRDSFRRKLSENKRFQNRNQIFVTGLPNHLSRESIKRYFERFGKIKEKNNDDKMIYMFTNRNGNFDGRCKITFDRSDSAKEAVEVYNGTEYRDTGIFLSVSMALQNYFGQKLVKYRSDWICDFCCHKDFERINFKWQKSCYNCQRSKPHRRNSSSSSSSDEDVDHHRVRVNEKKLDTLQSDDIKTKEEKPKEFANRKIHQISESEPEEATQRCESEERKPTERVKKSKANIDFEKSKLKPNSGLVNSTSTPTNENEVEVLEIKSEETKPKHSDEYVELNSSLSSLLSSSSSSEESSESEEDSNERNIIDVAEILKSKGYTDTCDEERVQTLISFMEKEMEDVLLNTFMNHDLFNNCLPLSVQINVSMLNQGSQMLNESHKKVNINLQVSDDIVKRNKMSRNPIDTNDLRIQDSDDKADDDKTIMNEMSLDDVTADDSSSSDVSEVDHDFDTPVEPFDDIYFSSPKKKKRKTNNNNINNISFEGDVIAKVVNSSRSNISVDNASNPETAKESSDKGRKKFTLDEDKEILDKIIEVLPGRSLASLELSNQALRSLSASLSRCESSISSRWKYSLRAWLIEYYSKSNKSWANLAKSSFQRRKDVATYFQKLKKKKGLMIEVMNATLKKH